MFTSFTISIIHLFNSSRVLKCSDCFRITIKTLWFAFVAREEKLSCLHHELNNSKVTITEEHCEEGRMELFDGWIQNSVADTLRAARQCRTGE